MHVMSCIRMYSLTKEQKKKRRILIIGRLPSDTVFFWGGGGFFAVSFFSFYERNGTRRESGRLSKSTTCKALRCVSPNWIWIH